MLGSTAAAHVASSLVYVNSKFPTFAIFQALNQDLDDLSAPGNGLFRIVSTEIDYNPAIEGYDLGVGVGSDVLSVLAVHTQQAGPSKDWTPLNQYRVNQSANTGDFASRVFDHARRSRRGRVPVPGDVLGTVHQVHRADRQRHRHRAPHHRL